MARRRPKLIRRHARPDKSSSRRRQMNAAAPARGRAGARTARRRGENLGGEQKMTFELAGRFILERDLARMARGRFARHDDFPNRRFISDRVKVAADSTFFPPREPSSERMTRVRPRKAKMAFWERKRKCLGSWSRVLGKSARAPNRQSCRAIYLWSAGWLGEVIFRPLIFDTAARVANAATARRLRRFGRFRLRSAEDGRATVHFSTPNPAALFSGRDFWRSFRPKAPTRGAPPSHFSARFPAGLKTRFLRRVGHFAARFWALLSTLFAVLLARSRGEKKTKPRSGSIFAETKFATRMRRGAGARRPL